MATISELVARIRQAVYGEEVRESIAQAIEQVTTDVDASVKDWLDDHPEATTTVEDGSISDAKLSTSLKESLTYVNSINKEITLNATKIGKFTHSTSQIQGMTTDGSKLYICGTSGDTTKVIIYEVTPGTLAVVDHTIDAYGHPNSADYFNGKLYLAGCMQESATTDYGNICIVDTSSWTVSFVDLPGNTAWWSAALLKAYNNKFVLAGHKADSTVLDLYATAYGTNTASATTLGLNKFLPWTTIDIGAFSCDPTGMCQYNRFILIGDAHLSNSYAKNAIRCFTSDGALKATLYLPIMGDNELEDVCVIGNTLYTVDISGNVYSVSLSGVLSRDYGPEMFRLNTSAGMQYAYINENGTENYDPPLATGVYITRSFRLNPWFHNDRHWITDGAMLVRTGSDTLILEPHYEGDHSLVFCGSGKSGRALVHYYFKYIQSTPNDNNEYLYTLTTFGCTAHYNGEETTYSTPEAAAAAGYFHGYTYIRELISESGPKFTNSALTL